MYKLIVSGYIFKLGRLKVFIKAVNYRITQLTYISLEFLLLRSLFLAYFHIAGFYFLAAHESSLFHHCVVH